MVPLMILLHMRFHMPETKLSSRQQSLALILDSCVAEAKHELLTWTSTKDGIRVDLRPRYEFARASGYLGPKR